MNGERFTSGGLLARIEARVIAAVWPALIEMKSVLVDVDKAARRIAGHLNASVGAPVLWIVGLDEKTGKFSAVPDHASWWASVQQCFDGIASDMTDLRVQVGSHQVLTLCFRPERLPFVVKNPQFGGNPTPVELEVPWRTVHELRSAGGFVASTTSSATATRIEVLSAQATL